MREPDYLALSMIQLTRFAVVVSGSGDDLTRVLFA